MHLFCETAEQEVTIDRAWLAWLLQRNPLKLARERGVPVLCNQWGVKRSVSVEHGRLRYAEDVASLFEASGVTVAPVSNSPLSRRSPLPTSSPHEAISSVR